MAEAVLQPPRRRRGKSLEEKCAWMKARQQQERQLKLAPIRMVPTKDEFPPEMLEKKLSLAEIAALYQWGYHKTYRFWKDHPRTIVEYLPNPIKAPKMSYQVPKSVVVEEWQRMESFNRRKMDQQSQSRSAGRTGNNE